MIIMIIIIITLIMIINIMIITIMTITICIKILGTYFLLLEKCYYLPMLNYIYVTYDFVTEKLQLINYTYTYIQ